MSNSTTTNSPEFTVLFICSFTFCRIRNYNSGSRQKFQTHPDPQHCPSLPAPPSEYKFLSFSSGGGLERLLHENYWHTNSRKQMCDYKVGIGTGKRYYRKGTFICALSNIFNRLLYFFFVVCNYLFELLLTERVLRQFINFRRRLVTGTVPN